MLDVKKLITGFLILALGASMSAWILSNVGAPQIAGISNVSQATTTSLGDNAFDQSENPDVPLPPDTSTSSSTNLTYGIADAFVNGLVAANPNGPEQDANGSTTLATPDVQTLTDALQSEPALQNVSVPDWDTEVGNLQGKIKTVPETLATMSNYIDTFNKLTDDQLVKTGLSSMTAKDGSPPTDEPSVVAEGGTAAANILSGAIALPTPTSFADFQKSLIKMLVYEKDLSQLVQNLQDPAMAAAIFQVKEADYETAVQEFDAQGQSLSSLIVARGNLPGKTDPLLSFVNSLLFINEANAQIPVTDVHQGILQVLEGTLTANTTWATFFENLAKNMLLQITKNILMALVQQKVLAFIQNSGAPRFITNWGTEMVNAAEQSALSAINSNFACINTQTVFPKIQVILNAIYKPGNNACAAQFQSQLSSANLNNFMNNFSNGSFVTFGQTMLPTNDFYSGLYFTSQQTGQATQQSQNLFTVKSTASQGYRSSQVCPDGSDPNGFHCQRPDGSIYNVSTASCQEKSDGTGSDDILTPNNGLCANGSEPQVTMPGIINTQAMDKALGGHTQLIAAANDIAGLVQAAANSLLMGLVNAGVNAVTQTVNGALQGDGGVMSINPTSITAPTATSTATSALSCSPASLTLPEPGPTSIFALGGTYDASGNAPTYTWSSSPDGQSGSGNEFDVTYNSTGTFVVTLSDSQSDAPATCTVIVDDDNATSTATSTAP
jgi:hypothetical protein